MAVEVLASLNAALLRPTRYASGAGDEKTVRSGGPVLQVLTAYVEEEGESGEHQGSIPARHVFTKI